MHALLELPLISTVENRRVATGAYILIRQIILLVFCGSRSEEFLIGEK